MGIKFNIPSFPKPKFRLKLWLRVFILSIPFIVIIGFTQKKQAKRMCKTVKIKIDYSDNNFFVDENEILAIMTNNGKEYLVGEPINEIPLRKLEQRILRNPFINYTQVYKDVEGNLQVEIDQEYPVARVIHGKHNFYISRTGKILPVSKKYTARVPIIEGPYSGVFSSLKTINVPGYEGYLDLLLYIENDEFLKSQITGIILNTRGELTLCTLVGNHKIEMGMPTELESKFKSINIFYTQILPAKGWNTYRKVNLKYQNQIICEK